MNVNLTLCDLWQDLTNERFDNLIYSITTNLNENQQTKRIEIFIRKLSNETYTFVLQQIQMNLRSQSIETQMKIKLFNLLLKLSKRQPNIPINAIEYILKFESDSKLRLSVIEKIDSYLSICQIKLTCEQFDEITQRMIDLLRLTANYDPHHRCRLLAIGLLIEIDRNTKELLDLIALRTNDKSWLFL